MASMAQTAARALSGPSLSSGISGCSTPASQKASCVSEPAASVFISSNAPSRTLSEALPVRATISGSAPPATMATALRSALPPARAFMTLAHETRRELHDVFDLQMTEKSQVQGKPQ